MVYIVKKRHYRFIFILLLGLLFFSVLLGCSLGSANISIKDALKIIVIRIPVIGERLIQEQFSDSSIAIVWNLRMPRTLLAAVVGAALAFSGATYQGLFKNPMAESYVLGVSSGAALGATIAIVFGISRVMGFGGVAIMSFVAAIGTTILVYELARGGRRVAMITLLLAGVAVNFLLSAINSLLLIYNKENMERVVLWTMGSLAGSNWTKVTIAFFGSFAGMISTSFFSKDLNLLLMGEEDAKHLGVNVEKTKKILLALSSFIAAMAVSVSGIIGFVGMIVPHAIRLVTGPDHRIVLPYSAIMGGIFLIVADILARTLASPMEIPVGIITAMTGAPFFLYLLIRDKKMLRR